MTSAQIDPQVERDPQTGEAIYRPGYTDGWSVVWLIGGLVGLFAGHRPWIMGVAVALVLGRAWMAHAIAVRGRRPGVRYEPQFFE